jgi:hypothetical protein
VQWAIGFALNNLALRAYQEGDLMHAFALVSESVSLFRAQQADASLAEVLITQAQILRAQGDGAAAYTALREALQLAWVVGPRLMVAAALEGLASVVVAQGVAQLAVQCLAAASALCARIGAPMRPADESALAQALATARAALGADTFAAVGGGARAPARTDPQRDCQRGSVRCAA